MRRFVLPSAIGAALMTLSVVSAIPASAATVNVYSAAQSGVPGFESSMAFTPTADPTLLAQLDNQQGSDADSTGYSQAFQIAVDATVNTVTWWGTGANQAGFMVAIHDGVWGSSTSLPNGPVVEGTLASLSVVPIANVSQTPSIGGETRYQISIPPTPMFASHAYRLSVTAVGGNFEWDTSSAAGCCGGSTAVNWVRGRLQSYLAMPNVSFSLDNSTSVTVAPAITTSPSNTAVTAGQPYGFSAAASGVPTPSVQWQVSTDGGATFSDIAGAIGTTYSGVATSADNANQFRAVFTNSAGSATTNAASLSVASSSSIVVSSSVPAPLSGQKTKLVAIVTSPSSGAKAVSGGTVTFFDGTGQIASAPVKAGKASVTLAFPAGAHAITASFGGWGTAPSGQSSSMVLPVGQGTTSVTVAGASKVNVGRPASFVVKVKTAAPAKGVATGTVSFLDGSVLLGTAPLDATGKAVFTTSALAVGTHSITVTYNGDPNHGSSSAPHTTTVA